MFLHLSKLIFAFAICPLASSSVHESKTKKKLDDVSRRYQLNRLLLLCRAMSFDSRATSFPQLISNRTVISSAEKSYVTRAANIDN